VVHPHDLLVRPLAETAFLTGFKQLFISKTCSRFSGKINGHRKNHCCLCYDLKKYFRQKIEDFGPMYIQLMYTVFLLKKHFFHRKFMKHGS
jgi:hypothetical protein